MPFRFSSFIFLFGVILFALKPCVAQETPLNTFPFDQKIVFEPYPDSRERITNHLLQHIADGSGRLRSLVSYSIEGQVGLRWEISENGKRWANFSIETLKLRGDISYGGFSLQKILSPDLIQFTVLISKPDGKLIVNKKVNDFPVNGSVILREEIPSEKNNNGLIVRFEDIHFSYSESMYYRLEEWFGFLEEYYAAGALLDDFGNGLETLNFSDPAKLILEEFTLCEAEKDLASLANMGFMKNIGPNGGDPEGVFLKYGELLNRVHYLRNEFNQRMVVIDSLLYVNGLELLTLGNFRAARERFESSLVLNPFYVPSHLALAELDLKVGQKKKAIERLGEVFAVINPHGKWRTDSETLVDSVMAHFFREAFNLNREGRFKENLDVLAPLEQFCERVEGDFRCPQELEFRLNQTHMGMYRSFLVVGGRALRNDNLSLCRTYVSSALDYQMDNQRFIPDAREAYDILQQCVYRYIEVSGERFAKGEYQRSHESLEAAMGLCEQYPRLFCPSDLPSRQQMVLGFLKQSETVTQTVTNSPSESFELMSDTILGQPEEKLLEQISQGQFLAWAGKVEDAKAAEEKIMLTIQNLRLKNDARIASEMNKLGVMIQEKECELAARELDALLQIGMRYLTFSEYRMAFGTGEEIMALLENHPQCNLPHNDSIDRLTKLGPIIKYLEMIEDATSYYQSASSGMYPEFFRKYLEAEIYFENQGLAQQGLNHMALSDFIISSGNVELAKEGIVFMAEQAETFASETVSLLLFLKNQGLSISQTQAIQEFAGKKLARYFFSRGTGVQPEALVHSLTHNDQWFRTFEMAFIRHWGQ